MTSITYMTYILCKDTLCIHNLCGNNTLKKEEKSIQIYNLDALSTSTNTNKIYVTHPMYIENLPSNVLSTATTTKTHKIYVTHVQLSPTQQQNTIG